MTLRRHGYAGATQVDTCTERWKSSDGGRATAFRRTVLALVAACALALAAAGPARPAGHGAPQPTKQGAHLRPLWRQFPLKQSTATHRARSTTTPTPTPTATPTTSTGSPRARAEKTSGTNRIWRLLAVVVLAGVAGALAWLLVRRRGRRRQEEAPVTAERPHGGNLLIEPAPVATTNARVQPPRLDRPTELPPNVRPATAVAVRKLMERHLYEGSNGMSFEGRDTPSAGTTESGTRPRESYDVLGSQIASLLEAAQDSADEIRRAAKQEAEDVRADAERYSEEVRRRADAAAAERQAGVDGEIARIVEAAEERARQIEESAVEHRKNLVAESRALEQLLDDRRQWLHEMIGAFRDVTNRLEGVVAAGPAGGEDAGLSRGGLPEHDRRGFVEAAG